MIWNNLLKPKMYVGIIVLFFVVLGVYLWAAYQHNQELACVECEHCASEISVLADLYDLPPIPEALKREWAAKHKAVLAEIDAEAERRYLEERPQMVAEDLAKSYPNTAAARAVRAEILAALEPIDAKSESEIIQIIMDFFPENVLDYANHDNGLAEYFTMYYQVLSKEYEKPEVVLSLVYDAERNLTGLIPAAEESERREELRRTDPNKYYDLKEQDILVSISETEAEIQKYEAMGRSELADPFRSSLASLNLSLSSLETDRWFAAYEARRKAERAAAAAADADDAVIDAIDRAGGAEWLTELVESMNKRVSEMEAEIDAASAPTAPGSPLPSEPSVSGAVTYDPVRSFSTTQASLAPWRSTLDKDYLDVFVSRSLSAEELHQYFPTQAERDQLKSRTTEMRKAVVSKIHNVVNGIQGATVSQKRALARKLATSNFDADFAESVLKQLDFDDK